MQRGPVLSSAAVYEGGDGQVAHCAGAAAQQDMQTMLLQAQKAAEQATLYAAKMAALGGLDYTPPAGLPLQMPNFPRVRLLGARW